MKKTVQLKTIGKSNNIVVLDAVHGIFTAQPGDPQFVQGNYFAVGDQELSVFASDRNLYLQWNEKRWNFNDLASKIRYLHDFRKKMTTFSVENVTILNILHGGPMIRRSTRMSRNGTKMKTSLPMSQAWRITSRCGRV